MNEDRDKQLSRQAENFYIVLQIRLAQKYFFFHLKYYFTMKAKEKKNLKHFAVIYEVSCHNKWLKKKKK